MSFIGGVNHWCEIILTGWTKHQHKVIMVNDRSTEKIKIKYIHFLHNTIQGENF